MGGRRTEVALHELFARFFGKNREDMGTGVGDIILEELVVDVWGFQSGLFVVERDEVASQAPVLILIRTIKNQVDEVEAGEEGGWELDVLHHRELGVVPGIHGVGGGEDGGAGVEGADDAGLEKKRWVGGLDGGDRGG